jgi:hypothetical protein
VTAHSLSCPTCGKSGFSTNQKLASHQIAHQKVKCEVCGRTLNRAGLGPHLAAHRRQAESPEGRHLAALAALTEMLGAYAADGIPRIRDLVQQLDEFPAGAFVVLGAAWGPHLTSRPNVGQVVAAGREACVVVPLQLAADAARRAQIREAS